MCLVHQTISLDGIRIHGPKTLVKGGSLPPGQKRDMLWGIVNLCLALNVPIGCSYVDTIRIPLVGEQRIRMDVLTEYHSRITLDGFVRSSGLVSIQQRGDGSLKFDVQEPLSSIMKRYGCSISRLEFDARNDEARLRLTVRPIFYSRDLRLRPPSSS